MKEGNKSDTIDARRPAGLLRLNHLSPVYHREHGLHSLKELVRSYLTITKDLTRVMSRVKAIYRSWAIPCTGKQVYAPRHRAEWLGRSPNRACAGGPSFTISNSMRCEKRGGNLAEGKKHPAWKRLCPIPSLVRSAPRCYWPSCRPRIVSAPSDGYGSFLSVDSKRIVDDLVGLALTTILSARARIWRRSSSTTLFSSAMELHYY
jgi:hypothetical protein